MRTGIFLLVLAIIILIAWAGISTFEGEDKKMIPGDRLGGEIFHSYENFVPALIVQKLGSILTNCETLPGLKDVCQEDVAIQLGQNKTRISTGYSSIDAGAPAGIKGYIYSMSTTVGMNENTLSELDDWLSVKLPEATHHGAIVYKVPSGLRQAFSPLLYPESGDLYLIFDGGKVSGGIVRSRRGEGSFVGYKYYNGGRFFVRFGPIGAKHITENVYFEIFPLLVRGAEGALDEWWPSDLPKSVIESISLR